MDFHKLKRRELQALCKNNKIPANLTNLEMANKLTALLTGNEKPITRGAQSCLKALDENANDNESHVENRPAKKVKFSPDNDLIEFETSEVVYLGIGGQERRKSVMNEGTVVQNRSDVVVYEEFGKVRRSRRGKKIESSEVENKGGKGVMKGGAVKDNNPSSADSVPLVDLTNEEDIVVSKRSLRNREVVIEEKREKEGVPLIDITNEQDRVVSKRSLRNRQVVVDEKRENEGVEKGSRRNGNHPNLRPGYGKDYEDVVGSKGTEAECVSVQNEKVFRRSKRHVAKVDHHKLVNKDVGKKEIVTRGRSKSMVAMELNEGSGIDITSGMVVKKGSLDVDNLRRSKRNANKPECLITMEQTNEVANANDEKETKSRRKDAVLHVQAIKIDGNCIERSLRRSTCYTERSEEAASTIARAKVAQEEKSRSKKRKVEVEDSFTENILTTKDLPAPYTHLTMAESAKDTAMDTNINTVIELSASDFGSTDPSGSNFLGDGQDLKVFSSTFAHSPLTDKGVQKQAPGTSGKSVHLHLDDSDVQKQGGETCTDEKEKEGNDAKQALYMRKTPLIVKHDGLARHKMCVDGSLNDVTDELNEPGEITEILSSKAYSVSRCKITKETEMQESFVGENWQLNLEDGISTEDENPHPLNAVCKVSTTDTVHGCNSDAASTPSNNAIENEQEELTSTMHSWKTLKREEESLPVQRKGCEAHNLSAADTNVAHHELNSFEHTKSDEDGHSKVERETSGKGWEPNASEAFGRSATRKLQDGNDGSGEDITQPADLHGRVLVATPISAKAVKAVTEFSETVFNFSGLEPPKTNITLEFKGESLDIMDLETNSEQRGVEAESIGDAQILVKLNECEDVGDIELQDDVLEHFYQSHELNSCARTEFSVVKDQDVTNSEVSVAIPDAHGVILSQPSEGTQITEGRNFTEIQQSASKSSSTSISPINYNSIFKHQVAGTNGESEQSLLRHKHVNEGNEACGDAERIDGSVPKEASYIINTTSKGEDDDLDSCNMCMAGSFNSVITPLNDALGSTKEGMELKGNSVSGCEVAIEKNMDESYIGEDGTAINMEKSYYNELETDHALIAAPEVATTGIDDGCTSESVQTPSKNSDDNVQGEKSSTMNSRITLKQMEELTPLQRNGCEALNLSASETIFDHHELNSVEYYKSDGSGHSKLQCDISNKCQESIVPDTSRSTTKRTLQDGNVHGGESFVQHADLQGAVSATSPISSTRSAAVETVTEFSESTSDFIRVESPKANSNIQFQGVFSDTVDSEKRSELRTQSSSEHVGGYFIVEAYTRSEDGQNLVEVAEFEEGRHPEDKKNAFDDCLLHEELGSSGRSKFSHIQDQGVTNKEDTIETADSYEVILSPPSVATQIFEGKCTEIQPSARKFSPICKSPPNSNFILKSAGTNTESENAQNQGHRACSAGEKKEEVNPMQTLYMTKMPSTSVDNGLERSKRCVDESLHEVNDVLNGELEARTEDVDYEGNCVSGCEASIETDVKESYNGEEGRPIKLDACNTNDPEVHSLDAALEVSIGTLSDGCPSHAAHSPLKNSTENEQDEVLEILFAKPVSASNIKEEKNTLSHKNEVERDMMSLKKTKSTERDGCSCEFDELFNREELDTSNHEDHTDTAIAAENEVQSSKKQNSFPISDEEINGGCDSSNSWHDELKMLFGDVVTAHENNTVQKLDSGAFSISNAHVASAECGDGLVLKESVESNGTAQHHDEQKIGNLKTQIGIEIGEEIKRDELTESGAEVHVFSSLEMNTSPRGNKEDGSFLYHIKDAKEELTSVDMLFGTEVVTEEKVSESDIQDLAASESSISKDHEKDSEVDTMLDSTHSESTENQSLNNGNPKNTLHSDMSTEVAEVTPLVEPEAQNSEWTFDAACENETASAKEQEQGEAREEAKDLVTDGNKLFSGTANQRCLASADGGITHEAVPSKSLCSGRQLISTIERKKKARTILILGTPNKLQTAADMKENVPKSKMGNVGNLTTVRPPSRRPALKDLLQK